MAINLLFNLQAVTAYMYARFCSVFNQFIKRRELGYPFFCRLTGLHLYKRFSLRQLILMHHKVAQVFYQSGFDNNIVEECLIYMGDEFSFYTCAAIQNWYEKM